MKFLELFDHIMEKAREEELTDSQSMIWLTMIYLWKKNNYRQELPITQEQIQLYVDASRRTVQRAIKTLIEANLINANKRHRKPTTYTFNPIKLGRQTLHSLGVKSTPQEEVRASNPTRFRASNPRASMAPPNTNTNTNINTITTNTNKRLTSVQQPNKRQEGIKPKRLSMWVLKNQKESRETELKELRDKGHEDAWGHHWNNKEDAKRAKVLKAEIKELIRQMQDAY